MSSYERDHKNRLMLTQNEALNVRDSLCRDRDFWVYNLIFNKELLQAALDVLHNSIPGNHYTVEYKDCQNICRLIIYCKPCAKELSSLDPFKSHDDGKAHKKCVRLLITKKELERTLQHGFQRKPFNSPKEIFENNTLEYRIDHCQQRILGMQFIYKEMFKNSGVYWFSCQLCRIQIVDADAMFRHLTESSSHNRKYLRVKFGMELACLGDYEKECKATEEREGKINHHIIDFTKQNNFLLANTSRDSQLFIDPRTGRDLPATPPPRPATPPPRPAIPPPRPATPPLTSSAGVQTCTAELDANLPLQKELMLVKANGGEKSLAQDQEAMELMLQTLQVLNMKLHKFYDGHPSTRSLTQKTAEYQTSVQAAHAELAGIFTSDKKTS